MCIRDSGELYIIPVPLRLFAGKAQRHHLGDGCRVQLFVHILLCQHKAEMCIRDRDIIVVGKGQIFPCRKLCRSIGVCRNALVFDLFVYDALILCLIFLHDALHIGMFCIGSIRKAERCV